ncbi:MAG TPA: Nif3-like dinuclear metal center hexameric protein, partial [Armatimonadota bacterium]
MNVRDLLPILEATAPSEYAVLNDRIGLQVGDPDRKVRRILVTVDVTPAIIKEAARQSADLIISHHPLIYNPLSSVRPDLYPQSLVYSLLQAGISVYVMHTNFDCADGGINDALAERLGVVDTRIMEPTYTEKRF